MNKIDSFEVLITVNCVFSYSMMAAIRTTGAVFATRPFFFHVLPVGVPLNSVLWQMFIKTIARSVQVCRLELRQIIAAATSNLPVFSG